MMELRAEALAPPHPVLASQPKNRLCLESRWPLTISVWLSRVLEGLLPNQARKTPEGILVLAAIAAMALAARDPSFA
jgi:hypothetical protein